MSRLFSLAAAGALLLSASSVAAEGFDVRGQLLAHKFGDSFSNRIARRQDDTDFNSTSPLDELTSSVSSAVAPATASRLTGSTLTPSRTGSAGSSSATASSGFSGYDGPDAAYLADMCMPNLFDETRARNLGIKLYVTSMSEGYAEAAKLAISLGGSPFPCEQAVYIEYACHANATKPVDFLAEQQCYCGSTFWDADQACNDCFLAHGLESVGKEEYGARMASFSSKVCAATPVPGGLHAAAKTDLPEQTTILDYAEPSEVAHVSQTAVSLYATVLPMSIPALTGEATARATSWGNWGNAGSSESSGSGGSNGAGVNVAPMVGAVLGAMALGAGIML